MRKINLTFKYTNDFKEEAYIMVMNEDGIANEIYDGDFNWPDSKIAYSVHEQQQIDYVNQKLTENLHETLTNAEIVLLLNPLTDKRSEASPTELQKLAGYVVQKKIITFNDLDGSRNPFELSTEPVTVEPTEEACARTSLQLLIDTRDDILSHCPNDQYLIDSWNQKIDAMLEYIDEEYVASYRKFEINECTNSKIIISQDNKELTQLDTNITPAGYGWENFAKIYIVNAELLKLEQASLSRKEIKYLTRQGTPDVKESAEHMQRLAGFSVEKQITYHE